MKIINKLIAILIIGILVYSTAKRVFSVTGNINGNTKIAQYLNESSSINYLKDYNTKNSRYSAVLEIKKLNLKKGLYTKGNINNNIDKNITLVYPNDYSVIKNSTIILIAHSGNSRVSHFNNLDQLNNNDLISIYSDGTKYLYKVIKKYRTKKTGSLEYVDNKKALLYLSTCDPTDDQKQLIVVSKLVGSQKY